MMESDPELIGLREKRDKLMARALELRDKLSQQQKAAITKKKIINMKKIDEILPKMPVPEEPSEAERFPEQLINLTKNVLGINYDNVQKKWLNNDLWLYKSNVVMKTLSFDLELTVDRKDDVNEVANIMCNFLEQDSTVLNEISQWVQSLTRAKNFSSLMFAFSEYNELYVLRRKILNKLVNEKFATIDRCTEDGGGIIVYLHSPKDESRYYAEYLWKLRFNPKTNSIEHCFVIESTDNDFVVVNRDLIEEFCKSGLKKNVLERLWTNACLAIDEYDEARKMEVINKKKSRLK